MPVCPSICLPVTNGILTQIQTNDLKTQTETRNSCGACLKHSKTKSKSFTRGRHAPDDLQLWYL